MEKYISFRTSYSVGCSFVPILTTSGIYEKETSQLARRPGNHKTIQKNQSRRSHSIRFRAGQIGNERLRCAARARRAAQRRERTRPRRLRRFRAEDPRAGKNSPDRAISFSRPYRAESGAIVPMSLSTKSRLHRAPSPHHQSLSVCLKC